jgi:hypothetical protein
MVHEVNAKSCGLKGFAKNILRSIYIQLHQVYESSNSEGKLEPMSSKKNCGTNGLEIIHFQKDAGL